ncbi:uncharacterized protein FTJAE_12908 [Fusarium tjaetaba]|uniref:Uncharacterized protein n=1 Tax=Fusarium tjaetaba TaxID=1567544 RepID=A0A8H5QN46_9HYPO|nr:uncharacterized protein FTJAE_12908 [Fusarium tjaetaba]KAF5616761.1 hypothetical protein FTJAE_12908 [Fusarium tjaetaba]
MIDMIDMEPTFNKKDYFKRRNLFDRGFFYNDGNSANDLPDHVEALRGSILDFTCDELNQKASDKDKKVANQGTDLTNRKVEEKDWEHFFRDNFFKLLEESILASESSCDNHIVCSSNARWVVFNPKNDGLGSAIPDRLKNESAPQPDYAFYFPINRPPANSLLALEPRQESALFSLPALKDLYTHGLRPSPFHPFEKSFKEKHLKCFPWLVIESKPKPGTNGAITRLREVAYSQAVNGSGCAVRLNEIAALYETNLLGLAHIPPVPAVTTVGPEVKVWITYYTENSLACRYDTVKEKQETGKGYMMQCIWDGDMRNSHDIAQFRFMLKNIYTWAVTEFRPTIAKYIDHWEYLYSKTFLEAQRAAVAFREEEMESRSRQQSPEADESPTKQLERTIERMMSLNLNERVTPTSNRHAGPISVSSTSPSSVRRSARIKARREAQLSLGLTTQLDRSASRLKETIAAGPSRRRESGTKFLAGPIEFEVDGSTSDDDHKQVEEKDESGEDDEECEDDDETDEDDSDEENLVWDYVRRQYVPVYK